MKGLKISFIAIVAVLAVSATIAAQAGIFEAKKAFVPSDCFQPSIQLAKFNDCTSRLTVSSTTNAALVSQDDHVFSVGAVFANPTVNCIGTGKICCITLEIDPNPCPANVPLGLPAQPQLSFTGEPDAYYRINTIFQKL